MKTTLFLALILLSAKLYAQDNIKFFEGSLAELKAEAKKQNKPVFIDCFTTWCGPCKMLATKIFTDKAVADFYNKNFICYELDMEKGEGLDFAMEYKVKSYPTLIYLNSDWQMLYRNSGVGKAAFFLNEGKRAADPERNAVALMAKYKNGQKDTAFLKQFALTYTNIDEDLTENVLKMYWKQVPLEKIVEPGIWEVFSAAENDIHSKAFSYVAKHRTEFYAKYDTTYVEDILASRGDAAMSKAAEIKDEILFADGRKIITESKAAWAKENLPYLDMNYYSKMDLWNEFVVTANKEIEKEGKTANVYNTVAWMIFKATDEKKPMQQARLYAELSLKADRNYYNLDTYANILNKQGEKADAIKAAQEAIKLADAAHQDSTPTRELLSKLTGKQEVDPAGEKK
jgi:thiol-disulfide isomerase/thioredoxin